MICTQYIPQFSSPCFVHIEQRSLGEPMALETHPPPISPLSTPFLNLALSTLCQTWVPGPWAYHVGQMKLFSLGRHSSRAGSCPRDGVTHPAWHPGCPPGGTSGYGRRCRPQAASAGILFAGAFWHGGGTGLLLRGREELCEKRLCSLSSAHAPRSTRFTALCCEGWTRTFRNCGSHTGWVAVVGGLAQGSPLSGAASGATVGMSCGDHLYGPRGTILRV